MVKSHPISGGFLVVKVSIEKYNYNNVLYKYKSTVVPLLRSDDKNGEAK